MSFYEAMQLGTSTLKPLIEKTEDELLKKRYKKALIVKVFLCLIFCMLVVTIFNGLFGTENSIVGVVTVIALLTFRFSNLDFKTSEAAITIVGIFIIFTIAPFVATKVNPLMAFVINFISLMTIVVLSCHNVILSNQSTFILSYLLLYGYELNSLESYKNRVIALILGGILVATVFYFKQRKIEHENSFKDIIKDFNLTNSHSKWQLKLVLAVTTAVLIGELLNLPRVIWIGFSCMSIMQPDMEKVEYRIKKRYPYVIIGSLIFTLVYLVIPKEYSSFIGILGGLLVGFSSSYTWQTAFNCFGALASATAILGVEGAIIMRIVNNIIGTIYSKIFNEIFNKVEERLSEKENIPEIG